MKCAWQAYLNLLPRWMRPIVDEKGRDKLQELRIRLGQSPQMWTEDGCCEITGTVTAQDIAFIINAASEYSPWTTATVSQGYLTAPGGHRIGICGSATVIKDKMTGIANPTSLCVRVARNFMNISGALDKQEGSILLIGPPGSGKTTLLRDLIRRKSNYGQGSVAVVDEREEIFPLFKGKSCFDNGRNTDVLSGCSKLAGIEAVLRSMNPRWIAVDEITAEEDCKSLLHAGWCGVEILATAHAGSLKDLETRPVYRSLLEYGLFSSVVVLRRDKSWTLERI